MGRMVRDPQLAPLIEKLYGSAGDLYTQKVAETLGVSWKELQNLPHAEVAFAIVARRDFQPSFVLLVDQGEVAERGEAAARARHRAAKEDGAESTIEKIEGVDVTVIRDGDDQDKMVGVFEKDNTIVAATDPQLIREILCGGTATAGRFSECRGRRHTGGENTANRNRLRARRNPLMTSRVSTAGGRSRRIRSSCRSCAIAAGRTIRRRR